MVTEPRGYWPATTMLSYRNALRGPAPSQTWPATGAMTRRAESCALWRLDCTPPRPEPPPELVPLPHSFRELEPAAATHGGILVRCAEAARALLAEPREVGVLHGGPC
jgi:Aminoglycoside/hydroxyurea antibiotic resistance kinase